MVWSDLLKRDIPAGWNVEQLGENEKVSFERGFYYSSDAVIGRSAKYYNRCLTVKQDQKNERLKKAGAVGGIIFGVGAGAAAIVKNGRNIIKFIA